MKNSLFIVVVLVSFLSSAQFSIETYTGISSYGEGSKFPIVHSEQNPDAAQLINEYLHFSLLDRAYRESDESRFENVFPAEGEIWGASDFDYSVIANNDRFFSVSVTCAYTGAYSEYATEYYSFVAETGERILLTDIFAETPLSDLGTMVNKSCYDEIRDFMNAIDTVDEYGSEQYQMYADCLFGFDDNDYLYPAAFYLEDSAVVFTKGRCSTHAMAALDDLWDFEVKFDFDLLTMFFNDNGMTLVEGGNWDHDHLSFPDYKMMKGNIAGKYPITGRLYISYGDDVYGVYWYDKVGTPIQLSGTIQEDGSVVLTEEVDGKAIATIHAEFSDGALSGTWTKLSNGNTLSFLLQL